MKINAITFDLDDTFWPCSEVIAKAEAAAEQFCRQHLPRISENYRLADIQALRREVLAENPEIAHDLTELRYRTYAILLSRCTYPDHHAKELLQCFLDARQQVRLYPDVLPCLQNIGKSYPLGVITNGNANIEKIGIHKFFSVIATAIEVGSMKPKANNFHTACSALSMQPNEVLHVGDNPVDDIYGAIEAGMQTAWLNRGRYRWLASDFRPDYEIQSLSELPPLIASSQLI